MTRKKEFRMAQSSLWPLSTSYNFPSTQGKHTDWIEVTTAWQALGSPFQLPNPVLNSTLQPTLFCTHKNSVGARPARGSGVAQEWEAGVLAKAR